MTAAGRVLGEVEEKCSLECEWSGAQRALGPGGLELGGQPEPQAILSPIVQRVDDLGERLRRRIVDEVIHFLRRWRQADQVEVEPANQRAAIGLGVEFLSALAGRGASARTVLRIAGSISGTPLFCTPTTSTPRSRGPPA